MKSDNVVLDKSFDFAVRIVKLYKYLRYKVDEKVLSTQVLKSGTSIGANIHEANYASSKADFINKFHIALKECIETEYWIEMLQGSNSIDTATANELLQECRFIRSMLVKSITTAKKNRDK